LQKTKHLKMEVGEYPTMLLKIKMLLELCHNVTENKRAETMKNSFEVQRSSVNSDLEKSAVAAVSDRRCTGWKPLPRGTAILAVR
jgi:hypothetical protein